MMLSLPTGRRLRSTSVAEDAATALDSPADPAQRPQPMTGFLVPPPLRARLVLTWDFCQTHRCADTACARCMCAGTVVDAVMPGRWHWWLTTYPHIVYTIQQRAPAACPTPHSY